MTKRYATVVLELGFIALCLFATHRLMPTLGLRLSALLDTSFVEISRDELMRILGIFLGYSGVILFGLATFNSKWAFSGAKRFVNELYGVGLAASLAGLHVLILTNITFAPPFFLLAIGLVALGMVAAFMVSSFLDRPEAGHPTEPGLIGAAFRTLISPAHLLILAVSLSPGVVGVLYKMDDRIANAINLTRVYFNAHERDIPFDFVDRFPGESFAQPIALAESKHAEGDLYLLERAGKIIALRGTNGTPIRETVLDFSHDVNTKVENGALGMALHPEFGDRKSANQGFVYVYYTKLENKKQLNRLARFDLTMPNLEGRAESQLVLFEQERAPNGFHNAGDVAFGPDGFLYVSVGNGQDKKSHQVLDYGLLCGILRIDVDQLGGDRSHPPKTQPVHGKSQGYYIPSDNPFVGQEGALEEFFAIGLRNPFRISFDQVTGLLWVGDNGDNKWEEINAISAGANCQYPYREGRGEGREPKPETPLGTETPPFYAYEHTAYDRSAIGGIVYRGSRLKELKGKYLFADNFSGKVFSIELSEDAERKTIARVPYLGQSGLSSMHATRSGEVLVTVLGSKKEPTGKVLRLTDEAGTQTLIAEASHIDVSTAEFFAEQCALCHGKTGRGDGPRTKDLAKKPKDLTNSQWQEKVSDQHIFQVISKGGTSVGLSNDMPGWHLMLKSNQIQELVRYVRNLDSSNALDDAT